MQLDTFIKWVGGKNQIIDKIYELFPEKYDNYYELFIGGGSVLINLLNELEKNNKILNIISVGDFNKDLIDVYNSIMNNSDILIKELTKIVTDYNHAILDKPIKEDIMEETKVKKQRKKIIIEETIEKNIEKGKAYVYYYYRKKYNKLKNKENISNNMIIKKSALFIFLNKTCFRGVYRENSKGEYNVPFGNYASPEIFNSDNITNLSNAFNKYKVTFVHRNFKDWMEEIKKTKNNFVYLDPPYYPENETSFTKYTSTDFNKDDHMDIINFCKTLNENNNLFLLSNSDTKFIKDNMIDFKTEIIECKRSINSKSPGAKTNEVLIYNMDKKNKKDDNMDKRDKKDKDKTDKDKKDKTDKKIKVKVKNTK